MQFDTDLTGKLLVALPGIGDRRFERSVIFLCAHTPEFAMGIILNKPMDGIDLHQLMEKLDIPMEISLRGVPVLEGGPVAMERGFVLHTDDVICEGATIEVDGDICMTATRDILGMVASTGAPRQSVFALGYAGWRAGQLESELADNAWIVCEPDSDLVFGDAHEHKWRRALTRLGVDPARFQSGGGHA